MAVIKFRNLNNGQATPIPDGEYTIGRNDDAYIHLEDSSVSRRHAMVINGPDGIFLEDLGSANGTAAHGAYLTGRVQINVGDVVHVGSVPFRVDPEVAGEPTAAPSAGLRSNNRAYMRRDTERLPAPGESGRLVETIAPEKLSAPDVNPIDADAEELNAITIREPQASIAQQPAPPAAVSSATPAPAIRATSQGDFVAPTAPAGGPHRKTYVSRKASQRITIPDEVRSEPVAVLPKSETPASQRTLSAPAPTVVPTAVSTPTPAPLLTPSPAPVPAAVVHESSTHWGWWLLMFLAGLGVGLLAGLYFARIFIEMGGKVSALPL